MSSEETGHVSLMEVTPTSGKGTLGTWWFLRQARARLDKTEHTNRSQGQERSYEQTLRRRGVRAPALEPRVEGKGSWTKCQGFKPDLRNSDVRHYRGGLAKRSHGGIVNPSCNRKGKNGNPSPTSWRARVLSQQRKCTQIWPREVVAPVVELTSVERRQQGSSQTDRRGDSLWRG